MEEMDREELRIKIREHDTKKWRDNMNEKSTLYIYREAKKKIRYEDCYSNSYQSEILAKARTNTLQLEE